MLFKTMKYIFDWFSHNERYFSVFFIHEILYTMPFQAMKYIFVCFSHNERIFSLFFIVMKIFFSIFFKEGKKISYTFHTHEIFSDT